MAIGVSLMIAFTASKTGVIKNIESRALSELQSTANMQASAMMGILNEQFLHLTELAGSISTGGEFANVAIQPLLESAVQTYRLCMLGFADANGDVTSYKGEILGNIKDRSYFCDVIEGTVDRKCEFLATTRLSDSPRVIFSIPVYRDGKIIGVLFSSAEIDVLENTVFQDTDIFEPSACIFVCDESANLIVGNEKTHEKLCKESAKADENSAFEQLTALWKIGTEETPEEIWLNSISNYVAAASLPIDGWVLYCVLDKASVAETFGTNMQNTIRVIVAALLVAFACAFGLVITYIMRKNSDIRRIRRSRENYKKLLNEMNCTVLEYIPARGSIQLIQDSTTIFNFGAIRDCKNTYEIYKNTHPEFDFEELEKALEQAIQTGQTHALDSILMGVDEKIHWMRTILVPIADENAVIARILVVLLDSSNMHSEFKSIVETVKRVQSGICRCRLNDPVRLEYYSDGLCNLSGYTRAELQTLISQDGLYVWLIYPADRDAFQNFIHERSTKEGTSTCEYRMACKDGRLRPVVEIMDTKRNSLGDMYGYSVIIDVQKYKQRQNAAEEKLEKTQQQLEWMRVKNSTSQMQPHFLFNTLASIMEIILEDPEYAADLLFDFTVYLRACINAMSKDDLIPFTQEMENIKAYVHIEQARFGEKLKVRYECTDADFKVAPLSIQSLVENAIRHGVYERGKDGGTVVIRSWRTENGIGIQVEDNGVGFDVDAILEEIRSGKRDSTGLTNLMFRAEKLMHAKVDVKSRINVGTCITLTIPRGEGL